MTQPSGHQLGFQYAVLRCVPRADREEYLNVGVLLYCQRADYLAVASELDEARIRALSPGLDLDRMRSALEQLDQACHGAGTAGELALGPRFGWLTAPRSTVLRPGPIHGGITADPGRELENLLRSLVG